MDGASSVIAVVSLVIQLADSVNKIHEFLKTVRSAPAELTRLIEELDTLHTLLDDSKAIIELQASSRNARPPLQSYNKALKLCESSITPLDTFVEKNKARGSSWASFKLSRGAKVIENCEREIDRAIGKLHLAFSMNNVSMVQMIMMTGSTR